MAVSQVSRRHFLHAGTALAGASLSAAAYGRVLGANDRIAVGFIGHGLIGTRHVLDFKEQPDVRLAGIAETHADRRASALAVMGTGAREYTDFRELIDAADVDAVCVSTPDHWHALQTMLACAAGKDVYVEKPVTLFPAEGGWMLDVAKRHSSVVQVGTQQRSGQHYAEARRLIQEGHIGQVSSVRMQAVRNVTPGFGNFAESSPPPELDYDLWLGPAPHRPYHPLRGIYHFRWFWDYSGGQMTNLGQHQLDIVDWILGTESLKSVVSIGGRYVLTGDGETPDTQDALFEFDGWTAEWSLREASRGVTGQVWPLVFFGDKGSLALSRAGFVITPDAAVPPESQIPDFVRDKPAVGETVTNSTAPPRTEPIENKTGDDRDQFRRHVRNFLDCIRSREQPVSTLESGVRVANLCHFANISLRTGRKLDWDRESQHVMQPQEIASYWHRDYRSPWDRELQSLGVT
jgi:predicted dehydrogenase